MQIKYNITPRKEQIKYIIIHDTGNTSKGSDAMAHFNYFNSANRNSSADFFIDSENILTVNDYRKYYTWHCGDGKGKNGITNKNSVGIELCVNSDGDYEKAFENLISHTARLAKELNIDFNNILRHFDASGKICPASMSGSNWKKWNDFKNEVRKKMSESKFNDIKNHYAEKHIKKLESYGIINGDEKGMFNPDEPLTRGDGAIMLANALTILGK